MVWKLHPKKIILRSHVSFIQHDRTTHGLFNVNIWTKHISLKQPRLRPSLSDSDLPEVTPTFLQWLRPSYNDPNLLEVTLASSTLQPQEKWASVAGEIVHIWQNTLSVTGRPDCWLGVVVLFSYVLFLHILTNSPEFMFRDAVGKGAFMFALF